MKDKIFLDLPAGFRVVVYTRFSDGFCSIPSIEDSEGKHFQGLPRKTGDSVIIKITKL